MMHLKMLICTSLVGAFLIPYHSDAQDKSKQRILICTDIGGTDPDDFQSMIHLLMYADLFQIEGLISSPFGKGWKKDILDMIDLYEKDLDQLKEHSAAFPEPNSLREICKQGGMVEAPYQGFNGPTEGSDRIIKSARKSSKQPLWVLVWGGLEDVAQGSIPELDGERGQYVCINPWPGHADQDDYHLGKHWYSDRQAPHLFIEDQQGAKRWQWL